MTELKALCRILWRNRASSFVAIAMMGAAVSVAATTFALADAALLRALPYRDAEELQLLVTTHPTGERYVSVPDFVAAREASVADDIAATAETVNELTLSGVDEPTLVQVGYTTADYFRTLGIPLLQGRDFTRAEEGPGAGAVAIVTNRFWRDALGGRPNVVGESLILSNRSYTVVGVLPAYRHFSGDVDLYVPMPLSRWTRGQRFLAPIARVPPDRAETFLQALRIATNAPDDPDATDYVVSGVPLAERIAAGPRPRVTLLFAAGVGLLAVAALNFTTLIVARARQRQAEFRVRAALGATDRMIVRLVLLEAGTLCLVAGVCAALLSVWMLPVLAARYGVGIVNDVAIDHRSLLFALASSGTALVFAVAVTFRSARRRAASSRAVTVSRLVAGRSLVVAQIGISLALVAGSALLVRSFIEQEKVDPGFRVSERFTSRITTAPPTYPDTASRSKFWNSLLTNLWASEVDAAIASELPLTGRDNSATLPIRLANGERIQPKLRLISDRYLELMNIPIHEGRGIWRTDDADAPLVVVINEQLARLLPPGSALGQVIEIDFGQGFRRASVVGVVGDIRHSALNVAPAAQAYFSFEQAMTGAYQIVLVSDRDVGSVSNVLRAQVRAIDAGLAFEPVQPYVTHVERSLDGAKLQAQALTLFAVIATIVAAAGLYSLLTFLVSGARREWSIRLAIGATAHQLQRMVIGQAFTYAVAGSVLGVAVLALVASPLARSLYGVRLWDPVVAGLIALVLVVVTVAAALLPARQVSQISAAEVLQTSEPQ